MKLLLFLFFTGIQIASHSDADSLTRVKITEYENLIKKYRYSDQDSATYYAQEALEYAKTNHFLAGEAAILIQMGLIADNQGDFEASLADYQKAFSQFQVLSDTEGMESALIRLGVVDLRNGQYDKAVDRFLESLRMAETNKHLYGMMEANYSISWAYLDRKDYENALIYLKLADSYNTRLPFSSLSLNICNHFGRIYRDTGKPDLAKYYLEKGIAESTAIEYQGLNITMINNLATVYSAEGRTAKAIALQKEALKRSREIGNYLRELQVLTGLAKSYGNSQPQEAIRCIQEAVAIAHTKKASKQELRYLEMLTPLYLDMGNYQAAYETKARAHTLADSVFYQTMSENMAALKAEYELSKSEAKVKELNLLNNQRQLELANASILRNATFAGLVVTLAFAGLIYSRYRVKQRSSEAIRRKNESLEKLLQEKEWLMKEVHHRVKNNLQIVMSLLNSQSAYLENTDVSNAIRESRLRMQAMSLIHQKLYQTHNLECIDLNAYIDELVYFLQDAFDTRHRVIFQPDIPHLMVDVTQATPLGLILNEAISNSIKYAFPDARRGTISILLHEAEDVPDFYELIIHDDGVGMPASFTVAQSPTLGLNLIQGLCDQLDGSFALGSDAGVCLTIRFPKKNIRTEPSTKKMG